MKLHECTYCVLVTGGHGSVGMITGITENASREPIPMVRWFNGEERQIHHANIQLFEDEALGQW